MRCKPVTKGIALKGEDTILVADTYNHAVRTIKEQEVSTIIGAGVAGETLDEQYVAYLDGPAGVCYANEMLFIADRWNNRILIVPDVDDYLAPISVYLKEGTADEPAVYLNGKELSFADVKPLVIDGLFVVPIRAIAEAWGGTVSWNSDSNAVQVQKEGSLVEFKAEDFVLYEGRSLVGLQVLQDAFGFEVKWLDQEFIILIQER